MCAAVSGGRKLLQLFFRRHIDASPPPPPGGDAGERPTAYQPYCTLLEDISDIIVIDLIIACVHTMDALCF